MASGGKCLLFCRKNLKKNKLNNKSPTIKTNKDYLILNNCKYKLVPEV